MSVCFVTKKDNLCASNQQSRISKVLIMPCYQVICGKRHPEMITITFTETYEIIFFWPSSNNTTSSRPSCLGNKIKALTEVKYDE